MESRPAEQISAGCLSLRGCLNVLGDHYYSHTPKSEHDIRVIHAQLRSRPFTFMTDSSVFSKRGVDYGTRALIKHLPLPMVGAVLDVGCGYGPIGLIVAALSPQAEVTMVDVNRRALELCRKNAEKNNTEHVEIMESDGLCALEGRRFNYVLTNPPVRAGKRVIYRIFEQVSAQLHSRGEFWLVMHKKQGAPSAIKKLQTHFSEVTVIAREKGYAVIRCL